MAVSINEIKTGLTLLIDREVWQVIEYQHVKPGKGAAFVRVKLRNLKNNSVQEMTFRGDDKIEEAFIEERKLQYLYSSGDTYHFMDQENFEDITLTADTIKEKIKFLKENLEVTAYFYNNSILNISIPNFIDFKIIHTEPGVKGDTAKSGTKPAKIETGAIIQVPLFIETGDRVKVDTRTGEYIERVY
ncbi:MAG: elongation factor P [Candidatus Omnitrophica bacterium]|nr:elongation factor P [Candidatus Omnitrophota bacterium]